MAIVVHPSLIVKTANILEPSASERDEATVALTVGRSTPIDQRALPAIDGSGLTREEFFRVNGYGNRARVAYAEGVPDADAIEIARVERKARVDGLRAVLKDRPVAPPLPSAEAPCCDLAEVAPCSACVGEEAADELTIEEAEGRARDLDPEYFEAREVEDERERQDWERKASIPAFKITDDFGEVYFAAGPGLTLEKVIEDDVAKLVACPEMFTAERVVWDRNCIMAVIGKRADGSPYVVRLEDYPDDSASPVLPADDDGITDTAGPFDVDLVGLEDCARLTLPELITLEAKRLRARGNDAGALMARALEDLCRVVRVVGAITPRDVDARLEVLDRDYTEHATAWEMLEPEMTAGGRWA